jgi:hypothetical protein
LACVLLCPRFEHTGGYKCIAQVADKGLVFHESTAVDVASFIYHRQDVAVFEHLLSQDAKVVDAWLRSVFLSRHRQAISPRLMVLPFV